ncbi:trypsin-like peptidase domain-containing protein [Streptomyces sp. DSM 44915]|uniref:Trypsin-like peptidase domain-containing protein n=1 Tax=Streptomyces chisholmiae TaxID=3075540 RepID=A0ABU2JJP1_9ACTN|nr:trypsin-like peptidase domain-containing protein [Streptomyces sp. DSM 44915]MDT0264909.1 trypsin-like peptidase domain-containing protein [Streptomyces sp. DSM 44915]
MATPLPFRAALAALCLGTLLAGAGCTAESDGSGPDHPQVNAPEPTVTGELERTYQDVVNEVLPSVVQITTANQQGSGIVYDEAGHIVTNAHVVAEEDSFEVTLATGRQPLEAELVSAYPEQDLALLALVDPPDQLRAATFGDSAEVRVGQIVLAMGNPLGLASSVTQGIVSAVGRSVSEGEGEATLGNMVQTSAAINPGNSGGALVNLSGQVIGIPTLSARDPGLGGSAPGIGFAIPASTVTFLTDQLIEHGRVVDSGRAALGVSVRTVLGDGFQPAGVAVVEVTEGGPADRAGLRAGDVLTELGGEAIVDVVSLAEALATHRPDQRVPVGYLRDDEQRTADVTLGEA